MLAPHWRCLHAGRFEQGCIKAQVALFEKRCVNLPSTFAIHLQAHLVLAWRKARRILKVGCQLGAQTSLAQQFRVKSGAGTGPAISYRQSATECQQATSDGRMNAPIH
ncbi:hypothetical protein D3C81_822640 [compost metagenome]